MARWSKACRRTMEHNGSLRSRTTPSATRFARRCLRHLWQMGDARASPDTVNPYSWQLGSRPRHLVVGQLRAPFEVREAMQARGQPVTDGHTDVNAHHLRLTLRGVRPTFVHQRGLCSLAPRGTRSTMLNGRRGLECREACSGGSRRGCRGRRGCLHPLCQSHVAHESVKYPCDTGSGVRDQVEEGHHLRSD